MGDSDFERQLQSFADQANLKISELDASRARLDLSFDDAAASLEIVPFGELWEFSCTTDLIIEDADQIPALALLVLLEANARNERGFWCVATSGGARTLQYMHNIPAHLLTADEFASICRSLVVEVGALEDAFWDALRGTETEHPDALADRASGPPSLPPANAGQPPVPPPSAVQPD
jgi:hypothetical protein